MTAGEDEAEVVIAHWTILIAGSSRIGCGAFDGSELFIEGPTSCHAAEMIDGTVACGRHNPPRRVRGKQTWRGRVDEAVARPTGEPVRQQDVPCVVDDKTGNLVEAKHVDRGDEDGRRSDD